MSVFQKKNSNKFVFTSLKVMSSSLKAQESLIAISHNSFLSKYLKAKLSNEKPTIYFFVRNPYDRVVSVFENKLRSSPKFAIETEGKLEESTKIFFPLIDNFEKKNTIENANAILKISFEEFVKFLPNIYLKDYHYKPQHFSLKLKGWLPKLTPDVVIKMENMNGAQLKKELGIDLNIKLNQMNRADFESYYDLHTSKTIERLYATDFRSFDYPRLFFG